MLIIISPAKSLDFSTKINFNKNSIPIFLKEAEILIQELKNFEQEELSSLMNISAKLAELNFERFIKWHTPFNPENAKPALFVFKGDVYKGIDVDSLSKKQIEFANTHLRILSGLYGILSPIDLIQEYRLEMGTKLTNKYGKDLYEFWDNKITAEINKAIKQSSGEKVLINLASNEYFKSIKSKNIDYEIITPVFKDYKNGKYKIISFYAKKARGLMSRFIFQNNINKVEDIKAFNLENYRFNPELSKNKEWVYTR